VIGSTSNDGMEVADRPVKVPDLYATICAAVGLDPRLENISDLGRPIPIVDGKVDPIQELVRSV